MSEATGAGPGPRMRRGILWTGLALGTCIVTLAYLDGARPALPGVPHWLGLALGAVLAWLALAALVATAAELLRRHHRTIAVHAGRHGKRATIATARAAGKGGRSIRDRLASWAGPRWAARSPVSGGMGWATPEATAERLDTRRLNKRQVERDIEGKRNDCSACGNPGTPGDPLVIVPDGFRVHTSHTTDPADGYYNPASAPASAAASQNGEHPVSTNTDAASSGTVRAAKANAPAAWKALAANTGDFEPEDDGDLLEWMASEVAGMSAYGEALIAVYESCVDSLGLDPVAMSAVHDTADAAAEAAQAMAFARQKFAAHYSEVREFAASGGLLPFNGRWVTGEGEA